MKQGEEKRKHRRVPESLVFGLAGGHLPPGAVATIRVVDLSAGGVGFESNYPIPIGQTIEFEIPVPIRIKAKVVRAANVGQAIRYGGEFHQIHLADKRVLKAYLRKKMEALGYTPSAAEEKDDMEKGDE